MLVLVGTPTKLLGLVESQYSVFDYPTGRTSSQEEWQKESLTPNRYSRVLYLITRLVVRRQRKEWQIESLTPKRYSDYDDPPKGTPIMTPKRYSD